MTSAVLTLAIAGTALGGAVLSGLAVHGARGSQLGILRSQEMTVESVGDVMRTAAWETRRALADFAWLEAGVVFHRGLRDASELHVRPTRLKPWVPKHEHGTEGSAEMMPWVWLTTCLNPHHTRAYVLGGYFLAWQLNRSDKALEYLAEGARNNPSDGAIPLTAGKVHLLRRDDPEAAVPHLQQALENGFPFDDGGLEDELASVRFLAHALRMTGQSEEGLVQWDQAIARYPGDESFVMGRTSYLDLVNAPATSDSRALPQLSAEQSAAMEAALCPFESGEEQEHEPSESGPDHHDHGHDH